MDYLSLYRRFFDTAPDMFLSLGPAGGIILDANQTFYQTVGLLKSEVLGEPVERFVTLDHGWGPVLEEVAGTSIGTTARLPWYYKKLRSASSWSAGRRVNHRC